MSSAYPYAIGNRLLERNSYFYSSYGGRDFLGAWWAVREEALGCLPPPAALKPPRSAAGSGTGEFITADRLEWLLSNVISCELSIPGPAGALLNRMVQRFEITKRIHDGYNANFRAVDREAFATMSNYVRFGEILERAYAVSGELPHLNALLKCLDTLISVRTSLDPDEGARVARLILLEREHLTALGDHVEVDL